jgi:phosphopantothenoylcysteine synthetase/decarboxylase
VAPLVNAREGLREQTGSIAAYTAVGLASALHQAGAVVDVAMTTGAPGAS